MKKTLLILGSIFLALIVLGGLGIAIIAIKGNALDKESKAYADAAIPSIAKSWSKKELLDRGSPEFKAAVTGDKLDHILRWFGSLGPFQKCDPAQGQVLMTATTQAGKVISAQYVAKAAFEKGEATITLKLIKHGDQWQILGFHVDSPALVPQ